MTPLTFRSAAAVWFAMTAFDALPSAWAQGTGGSAASGRQPVATAAHVTEPLAIDGLLNESAWQGATPLTEFIQAEPLEGQSASERTEVRLLYDAEAIFIGVTL